MYLPTLFNKHIHDYLKDYIVSDCHLKLEKLKCDYDPDILQILYYNLLILEKLVKDGITDLTIHQLLIGLAEVDAAEVHLFLIRICMEKGWDYEFYQD